MWDWVSAVSPDVSSGNYYLNIPNQRVQIETPLKRQEVLVADDGTETTISYSANMRFTVSVQWTYLTSTQAEYIASGFNSTAYGNGMANSFKWYNTADSHKYVVKFASPVAKSLTPGVYYTIPQIKLRVLGRG